MWTARRDQLVARAVRDGLSLRTVARAVGLTHPAVALIAKRTTLSDDQ